MAAGERTVLVLGPIAARKGTEPCHVGGPRQRRLLAVLASDRTVLSADRIVDRVWGETQPTDPQAALRTAMTRLRQALGDGAIVTEADGWRLADAVGTDADQFAQLIQRAADPAADVHRRLGLLEEGLDLWRGDAYGDLADEDWARPEDERLEELRLAARERRFEMMLAAGMHTDVVPDLAAASDAHPYRDRLVGLRMLALYRTGRQAEATRVFQLHRERLLDELGLEPGPDLVELDRRVVARDPTLDLDAPPGRPLRGYRLGEQLGEGAFAVVFRGTQPSVGRDVAVKIIRPQLANRPEFVRSFEAEAHLVARLEHPHVVPLYDYWREPDRACLVFRYLRGGTLEQRVVAGSTLLVDEALTFVEQVGSALSEAHWAGVVHRDVKPANVFLDERGNYYLGDFGIAHEATEASDVPAVLSAGSPAYAAPEQLRREPVGPAADVHGLGISLFEALTGRLPFPEAITHADLLQRQLSVPVPLVSSVRTDMPSAVDEVIQQATAKAPGDRYASVEELVAAFRAAIEGATVADVVSAELPAGAAPGARATAIPVLEDHNPYKGLRAFTEADAAEFFGRERLVDRLVGVLGEAGTQGRIAAVVGPSGIGKSSVVRAGLLPALRRGAVAGSDRWFVAAMLPGREPFEEVAAALLQVGTSAPDNLMGQLTEDHRGLARVVKAIAPGDGDVLLVIDQFEELFTLADPGSAVRFLDALQYALADSRCPLRVVMTMRADFWDRPLRHGSFARLIDESVVNVTALAPDELERAIVSPAARAGGEFEPGLVSEIAADVADQPGALPLLQYALTELWERRISNLLTRDAYRQLGGVTGALVGRAEELYVGAPEPEQKAMRPIFARLVSLGEGNADTRRRAHRSELGDAPEVAAVLDAYAKARLLTFDRDPATREPTVEVAHESLLRNWPRLRGWVDEDRDALRLLQHLHSAAGEWDAAGRPDGELYRGARLETAEAWADEHGEELTGVERSFLGASIEARTRAEEAERAQLARERRNNRRLRALLGGVAVLLVAALVAGAVAFQQRETARDERAVAEQTAFEAETGRLVAQSASFVESNPRLAALLAVAAADRGSSPAELGALQTALVGSSPVLGYVGWGQGDYLDVEILSNQRIVALRVDGIDLYDRASGRLLDTLPATIDVPEADAAVGNLYDRTRMAAAVERPIVAVADSAGDVILLEAADELRELQRWSLTAPPEFVAVDPAGSRVAASSADWVLRVWTADGAEVFVSERGPAFETVGEQLLPVFGEDWAYADAEVPAFVGVAFLEDRLLVSDGAFVSLLAPDGTRLAGPTLPVVEIAPGVELVPSSEFAVLEPDGTIRVFGIFFYFELPPSPDWPDRVDASVIAEIAGGGGARIVGVDGAGPTTMLATEDGRIRPFVDGQVGDPVVALDVPVTSAAAAAAGAEWAVSTSGGVILMSDVEAGPLADAYPRPPSADNATVSRNGRLVVAGPRGTPGPFAIWDSSARQLVELPIPVDDTMAVGVYVDEEEILEVFGYDSTRGDVQDEYTIGETGLEVARTPTDHDRYLASKADQRVRRSFGSAGQELAYLGPVETEDGAIELPIPESPRSATFHPMRDWLLVGSDTGQAALYDTNTGESVAGIDLTTESIAIGHWSRDGRLLATAAPAQGIAIRDGTTFETIRTIDLPSVGVGGWNFPALIFSADNSLLLTNVDGPGRLWDVATGEPIGTAFPNPIGNTGVNWGEVPQLATLTDQAILHWNLDTGTWGDVACTFAGSNLTRLEWEQWGPKDQPYHALCPQWPHQG